MIHLPHALLRHSFLEPSSPGKPMWTHHMEVFQLTGQLRSQPTISINRTQVRMLPDDPSSSHQVTTAFGSSQWRSQKLVHKRAIPKFPVWIPDPQNTQALKKLFYTINLWDDLFSGNSNCNTETEILSQNLPHLAWALTLSSILLVPKCRGGPFLIYP